MGITAVSDIPPWSSNCCVSVWRALLLVTLLGIMRRASGGKTQCSVLFVTLQWKLLGYTAVCIWYLSLNQMNVSLVLCKIGWLTLSHKSLKNSHQTFSPTHPSLLRRFLYAKNVTTPETLMWKAKLFFELKEPYSVSKKILEFICIDGIKSQ